MEVYDYRSFDDGNVVIDMNRSIHRHLLIETIISVSIKRRELSFFLYTSFSFPFLSFPFFLSFLFNLITYLEKSDTSITARNEVILV